MICSDTVRPSDDQLSTLSNVSPNDLGHYVDFGHAFGIDYMGMSDGVALIGSALTVRIPPEDATMVHKATEIAEPGDVLVIDMQGTGRTRAGANSRPTSPFRYSVLSERESAPSE